MDESTERRSDSNPHEPGVTPPPVPPETSFHKKPKIGTPQARKRDMPEGLWKKCPDCEEMIFEGALEENLKVCPKCEFHYPFCAHARIDSLVDAGSFGELDGDMISVDTLEFTGTDSYAAKLEKYRKRTGLSDAIIIGTGKMGGQKLALGVMDFNFLGGSMGSVVGEKVTRLIELATEKRLPLVIISSSGGARMYEGMFSLMQMAKTSAAVAYHGRAKLPYISVLTHPTTAGVMASYASLGDLIISEPKAMIGFAGPRVIKDTTQSELPEGFQTAEFLMERGLIDAIVPRHQLKGKLTEYLEYLGASCVGEGG
jgi:acetyl-CoA carboxylase carboxyl transferase subunit beta